MNIYHKINEVRKKVSYVQKDRQVQGGGKYMAVSHDMVTAALRTAMVEQGIIVLPDFVSSDVSDTGMVTGSGTKIILYKAVYVVRLVNADEPDDSVSVMIEAHANDTGDKAPGKAISYAVKYAMLKVFSLETGEDDEGRLEGKPEPMSDEQVNALRDACTEYGFPQAETLKSLAMKVYGKKDITEVDAVMFDDAKNRLLAKHKQSGEKATATTEGK